MSGERLRFRRSWGVRAGAGGRARREGSFVDILPPTEGPAPPPPVSTSIIPDPSVDVGALKAWVGFARSVLKWIPFWLASHLIPRSLGLGLGDSIATSRAGDGFRFTLILES